MEPDSHFDFCDLVHVGRLILCSRRVILVSFKLQWALCVTTCMVQDAWRLCACVRVEMRTYMCESGSDMAAVAIAVDRETADASRGLKWPEKQ